MVTAGANRQSTRLTAPLNWLAPPSIKEPVTRKKGSRADAEISRTSHRSCRRHPRLRTRVRRGCRPRCRARRHRADCRRRAAHPQGVRHLLAASSPAEHRSEEHTSELQSLMRISYAVFCLKKKKTHTHNSTHKTEIHN